MTQLIEPKTVRLQLRQWTSNDRGPFADMSQDPEIMEYLSGTLTRLESDLLAEQCEVLLADRGWGVWAVELLETREFIGIVGLNIPREDLPTSPCVEILWRLARSHWGKGYAVEAARAALEVGFENLGLKEIVSFAAVNNRRSRAVMERLGMVDTGETFDHPDLPKTSLFRKHCFYTLSRHRWAATNA